LIELCIPTKGSKMPNVTTGGSIRMLALLAACSMFNATATSDEIDPAKVPPAVLKAADGAVKSKTALKNVKWTGAERYSENKVVKYDLEGESADEYGVSVTVTAAGEVEELQEQVDFEKTPDAVKKAIRATVPGIKEEETDVYKVFSGKNFADVSYEFEGVDANGRYVWLDSSPDGKIDEFYTEVPFKELPKPVQDAVNKQFAKRQSATSYVVHEQGKLARYDLEIVRSTGAAVHASYNPAGKEIKN